MNVASLGNTIYAALADDASAETALRAEFATLAQSIATDPASSSTITSATVNGQTFSARPTITQIERLKLLKWVVACFDNGGPISTTQLTRF